MRQMKNTPLNKLKHHVTGAVERGEKTAISAVVETPLQVIKSSVGSGMRKAAEKARKQLEKKVAMDPQLASQIEAVKLLLKKQGY